MTEQRMWNTATTLVLPVLKAGTTDLAVSADWTPVAGDVTISIDGGTRADVTALPTYANGQWLQTLTAAELSGKTTHLKIVDSAAKAVNDLSLLVDTYATDDTAGDFPQHWAFVLTNNLDKTGYSISAGNLSDIVGGVAEGSFAESYPAPGVEPSMGQLLYMIWSVLNSFTYAGDTLTTRKLDGTTAMTFTLDDADSPTGMERTS